MVSSKIEHAIIKFLCQSANLKELEYLSDWIEEDRNKELISGYIKTNYVINVMMTELDPSQIQEKLLEQIRKDKRAAKYSRINRVLKYAAMLLILISIGILVLQLNEGKKGNETITQVNSNVVLDLENGQSINLLDNDTTKIYNTRGNIIGIQQGNKIIYNGITNTSNREFNTLKIPNGRKFEVVLSDGTKILMNSGSSLKYPVNLSSHEGRQVHLEGEAFFDVTSNKVKPFVVHSRELNVEVLGTKFNINSYTEKPSIDVVLVEGTVGLSFDHENEYKRFPNDQKILRPGFKGRFNEGERRIETYKVNTQLFTSWVDGVVIFRNETFNNIIRSLERQYNVIIINNNEEISRETFNATIELDKDSIEDVLYFFNKVYGLDYSFINNKIIIS